MKSVRRRKTGRTNDPNYKKTHCANYHPTDDGASHPRPCAAACPAISRAWPRCRRVPPTHAPGPLLCRGPVTFPPSPQEQRRCFTGRSFGAAQHFSGTKAAAYASALTFFPPFFCFSLVKTMSQQQVVGNVLCSQHHDACQIKAWMFAVAELDWNLTAEAN